MLLDGNTAAALGCVYAGATVGAWYPITPATSLMEGFKTFCNRYRVDPDGRKRFCIVQAEDELAAAGMVIGASWAGAPAFGALAGIIQFSRLGSFSPTYGEGMELEAIVAAVIGGTLLTGGYGSALGAVLGALIFGMVQQGIVITGIDADWFQVFLGIMLVAAVLANNAVRRRVAEAR